MTAPSSPRVRVHHSSDEEARRDNVMAAVAELARKYDAHVAAGWTSNGRSSIAIGAVAPVVAAYRGPGEAT